MARVIFICLLSTLHSVVLRGQENEPDATIQVVTLDNRLHLEAINFTYGFVNIYIRNIESDSIENQVYVPPLDSVIFHTFEEGFRDSLLAQFRGKYNIKYFLGGNPATVNPDEDYLYSLPFKKGKKYTVSQGANGKFSHSGPISRYAIDFQLEIGEQVYAARGGRVIKVEEKFSEAGGRELIWKANRIIILHSDGTTGSYVHLNKNGALVKEGDYVESGQHIAYSGNTGFTRGPHLHFVVRKENDLSIPVYFEGYEGVVLKKRRQYKRR